MKLTPVVLTQHATVSITEAKEFNLSGKDIDEVEDISCCIELRKLNLSNNRLSGSQSTDGLRRLTSLTWLNLAHNELDQGEFLRDLTELTVLNLSNNRLLQLPAWLVSCTKLKALIVNNNKLVRVENVGKMTDLNTLVISHNEFEQLPALLRNLKLIKLSATHNALRTIPDYGHLTQLKELRLGNNRIASVPEAIASCQALEILDLGANLISGWSDIVALSKMTKLVNLNLKGNKLCEQPDYRAKLLQFIPTLRILDGERFDTKFLERRQKTKQFKEFAAEQIKQNKPFNWFRTKEEREQVRKEREQAKKELEQTEGSTGEGASKRSAAETEEDMSTNAPPPRKKTKRDEKRDKPRKEGREQGEGKAKKPRGTTDRAQPRNDRGAKHNSSAAMSAVNGPSKGHQRAKKSSGERPRGDKRTNGSR